MQFMSLVVWYSVPLSTYAMNQSQMAQKYQSCTPSTKGVTFVIVVDVALVLSEIKSIFISFPENKSF